MENHNRTRCDGDEHSNNETVYEIVCLQGMSSFCQLLYGFDIDALFVKAMTLIAKLSGNHS